MCGRLEGDDEFCGVGGVLEDVRALEFGFQGGRSLQLSIRSSGQVQSRDGGAGGENNALRDGQVSIIAAGVPGDERGPVQAGAGGEVHGLGRQSPWLPPRLPPQ